MARLTRSRRGNEDAHLRQISLSFRTTERQRRAARRERRSGTHDHRTRLGAHWDEIARHNKGRRLWIAGSRASLARRNDSVDLLSALPLAGTRMSTKTMSHMT